MRTPTCNVVASPEWNEICAAEYAASFFGGFCYKAARRGVRFYYGVLSKDPLTQEQVVEEILKYASQYYGNDMKAEDVIFSGV